MNEINKLYKNMLKFHNIYYFEFKKKEKYLKLKLYNMYFLNLFQYFKNIFIFFNFI